VGRGKTTRAANRPSDRKRPSRSAGRATWVAKPQAVVALSEADRQALQQCSKNTEALAALSKEVAEVKQEGRTFRQWVEPQIGVLLVRTDSRAYTPAPLPRH
jgi:alpha-ketoglutarate-dependent taurine dioxygenase